MKKNKLLINKIFNESCLDTLKKISNNSIDLVITSPPYNMNLRIRNGVYCSRQIIKELSTKYHNFSDNLPINEYYKFHKNVLSELLRVSNLTFYNIQIVTGSKRAFFKLIGDFSENLKEIIVWDKKMSQPSMQTQVLNKRTELILVFENDYAISRQFKSATFKRGTLEDIWEIKKEKSNSVYHGATFPEKLVSNILKNFSQKKDVVYDPFMGTGTTAIVAKKLGRNFIGSELNKKYYESALQRIEYESGDLFNEEEVQN